jgi:hypothetical protein
MTAVFFNSDVNDDVRRERLYDGELFVYAASPSTSALCSLARELAEDAFAPHDPRDAQHDLPVEQYVEILKQLKPDFIHHPESKRLIQTILDEHGCDLNQTYFDVPRLRTVTSDGYLTSGLGYAFKPHRDIWYSAPMCQLNWWLPVYPIESENAMAFHLRYWDRPIRNSSSEFNYQDWQQTGRKTASQHVGKDTRKQSEALEPLESDPQIRIVTEPGGLLIFSPAHLHSTVPNTAGRTRLSIDFRTVHLDDLAAERGAPNIDSRCTGTTILDYLRGSDLAHLPDEIVSKYEQLTGAVVAT